MQHKIAKLILGVLSLVLLNCSSQKSKPYNISEPSLEAHIKFLASDKLEGRLAGTEHSIKAGKYIKELFVSEDLESLEAGYFDSFDFKPRFKELYTDSIVHSRNIVAKIEGSDPQLKHEIVIIGAHYDHLGHGGPHTSSRQKDTIAIHNGADDNASGVSALLELSRKINAQGGFKRTVLFIAFGAEEQGLIGSRNFINNHPKLIEDAVVMMNFDMIGRLRNNRGMGIGGTGTAKEMPEILNACIDTAQVNCFFDPNGKGGSDHHNFYTMGKMPVIFFHTGGHPDYHKPSDDVEKINFIGLKDITNLAFRVVEKIANRKEKLEYTCVEK